MSIYSSSYPDQFEVSINRQLRHMQAASDSDYKHLKECLLNAAQRFTDVADLLEKDRSYDPVSFLRASAARCKAEVEGN